MCEDPHEYKFIEIAFGWGPNHIWFQTTLEDLWPDCMMLEVYWDGLWRLSYGLSQFHGHGSWGFIIASIGVCVYVCSCVFWQCRAMVKLCPRLVWWSLKNWKSQKLLLFWGRTELDEPDNLSPFSYDLDQFWSSYCNPCTPGLPP
jgi:hypothetical protein